MDTLEFNNNSVRKVPINRNNLFYSKADFEFEQEVGKEYVEEDMNQTAVLYQVDLSKTNNDDIYGETNTDQIQYLPPVEFHCVYEIQKPELKAYEKTKNIGTYQKTGKLTVGVYQATLDELGVDIKNGDYIGIQVDKDKLIYFSVLNDGKNNYDNGHTMYGTVPFYRTVECAPVDESEFNG